MLRNLAGVALAAIIAAVPAAAQTTAELLQKGIFAQDTQGNLDEAIAIYRQIVNSAPSQRDLAAQAQYRLAKALLQKGDLAQASVEFNKLARDYGDYQKLIADLASQGAGGRGGPVAINLIVPGGRGGAAIGLAEPGALRGGKFVPEPPPFTAALAGQTFDGGRAVTVHGKVVIATWVNPVANLGVDGDGGDRYVFATAAPNAMLKQGMTRATFKLGDEVTVTGVVAVSNQQVDGRTLARADTVTTSDGKIVFDRSTLPTVASAYGEKVNEVVTALAETNVQRAEIELLDARQRGNQPEIEAAKARLAEARAQLEKVKAASQAK